MNDNIIIMICLIINNKRNKYMKSLLSSFSRSRDDRGRSQTAPKCPIVFGDYAVEISTSSTLTQFILLLSITIVFGLEIKVNELVE